MRQPRRQKAYRCSHLNHIFYIPGEECTEQSDDPNCRTVGEKICVEPLREYSLVHCRTFCEFCGDNITIPHTEMMTTTSEPQNVTALPETMPVAVNENTTTPYLGKTRRNRKRSNIKFEV